MKSVFASILLILATSLYPVASQAQMQSVSFSQLDSLQKNVPKYVVVFLHTDWCKVCQQMKNTTFTNENVIQSLLSNFYFVSFNAESDQTISYGGHTFNYKPTGANTGVHELAEQLGTINGQLKFPTITILNPNNEIVFQYGGLMTAEELLAVLEELK